MNRIFTDQLGRQVEVTHPPKRIVSLVPSQTELLSDLGLDEEVVGITRFCVHPAKWEGTKKRVGGTKNLNMEKIDELRPDLVIANMEENEKAQVEELASKYPVWISDVRTPESAMEMIWLLGEVTGRETQARAISDEINRKFNKLNHLTTRRCAYLIWWRPIMTVNSDTFIHQMMMRIGLVNVFAAKTGSRYPEITKEELIAANPEAILLATEPFRFTKKHVRHFQELLPGARVELVDGEMFSWYGSRMVWAPDYFRVLERQFGLTA